MASLTPKWDNPKKVRLPDDPQVLADKIYALRQKLAEKRAELMASKMMQDFAKAEDILKQYEEHAISIVPARQRGGVVGKRAILEIIKIKKPQVKDWDKFYEHIRETGEFDLLTKGLSKAAIEERWNEKEVIPGMGSFTDKKISVTKRKAK